MLDAPWVAAAFRSLEVTAPRDNITQHKFVVNISFRTRLSWVPEQPERLIRGARGVYDWWKGGHRCGKISHKPEESAPMW